MSITTKLPKSVLTKHQTKVFRKDISIDGQQGRIKCEIRHDDECGNGHNSFAITGSIYIKGVMDSGGCIHDEIVKYFPEFEYLIKWHLMSSDEPMHYIANTLYHARDRTHVGVKIGDAVAWDTKLKFRKSPFTFKEQEKTFWKYLDNVGDFNNIDVTSIKYDGADNYDFSDNYSFTGFIKENEIKQWYKAPFKSPTRAAEFLEALKTDTYEYVKTPIKWCEAVEPNLKAARNSAIWEDATLEQLQDKKALEDRIPELIAEFKEAVESVGFTY